MTRLEAIDRRIEAATKGPCVVEGGDTSNFCVSTEPERDVVCEVVGPATTHKQDFRNANFIAHNYADIPWMRERIEELRKAARLALERHPETRATGICRCHGCEVTRAALAKLDEPEEG